MSNTVTSALVANTVDLNALMTKVQAQDQRAFQLFYERTIDRVYRVAYAILNNGADAEDVVCDIFTKLWQESLQFSEAKGSVLGWLSVMTRNRCLDILRKKANQKKLTTQLEAQSEQAVEAETPLQLLHKLEENGEIRQAIGTLAEQQQTVILLTYFKGLTHQEISESLNLPLGTVKSHARRAIMALGKLLKKEE